MSNQLDQISFSRQLLNHFYVGIIITLFYIWISPKMIASGYPGLSALLIAEIFILPPLVASHLFWGAKNSHIPISFKQLIPYKKRLSFKTFLTWTIGGILVSVLVYIPLYPLGLFLRETLFSWLPEWYSILHTAQTTPIF